MPESDVWRASMRAAVSDSVVRTLETMFFDFAEPADAAPNCNDLACVVEFRGGCSGRLFLRVSESGARALGASFLGSNTAQLTREEAAPVVCELANMICGSTLSKLHPSLLFTLAEPAILDGTGPAEESGWSWFRTESGAMAIYLDGMREASGGLSG